MWHLIQKSTQNNYRPKCKTSNRTNPGKHTRKYKNEELLDIMPTSWSIRENINTFNFIIINCCSVDDSVKTMKDKPQIGRTYFPVILLTKDLCPGYIMNSYESMIR